MGESKELKEVLHIANDYSGSKVYKNLFSSLDDLQLRQIVYVPIRNRNLIDKNKIEFKTTNSKIIYSPILSNYTRINYNAKITRIVKDIETKIIASNISFIHAHTWFSDGAVAYELHKKYGIPYVVTIRNTDLNLFFKYMLHLRSYGMEILNAASKIIFISPIYQERFFNSNYLKKRNFDLLLKSIIIPNGVDEFWIKNRFQKPRILNIPIKLLYLGNFSKNKNVLKLIEAVEILNKQTHAYQLMIIGKNGKQEKKILKIINNKSEFKYLGEIQDKQVLMQAFRESDIFTMPSHSETFGLVYIEALSQDIPVVYTRNEGIDGCYSDLNIGESVISRSTSSIVEAIQKISTNYSSYTFMNSDILNNHNWNKIANTYKNIYYNYL
jgi:glycosyltransferase involved in cell wall biosynthesis